MCKVGLAYHESLDGYLSKVGQDEKLCSLGPLIAGKADEARRRGVVLVLVQDVESVHSMLVCYCTPYKIDVHSLCPVGAYNVQQRRLVIASEALVKLAHKGWLVNKGEASDGMDIGKVLLHHPAQVTAGGKTR